MKTYDEEIRDAEERFWRALCDNDIDTALRLTDETCVLAGPQGSSCIDRQSFKAMMEAAKWRMLDFRLDNLEVRQITENVAVAAYDVHEKLTIDGQELELDASDTSTWVRRDGQWVCAQHSEALHGDPFGRDRSVGD